MITYIDVHILILIFHSFELFKLSERQMIRSWKPVNEDEAMEEVDPWSSS